MASVAGAIAQSVGLSLKPLSPSDRRRKRRRLLSGSCKRTSAWGFLPARILPSPARSPSGSRRIVFRFGICTSSGTIGHSLSFGKADAVTVVARDAALADAAATALGNLVQNPQDIGKALELAPTIPLIEGALIIVQDKIGIWGNLELVSL